MITLEFFFILIAVYLQPTLEYVVSKPQLDIIKNNDIKVHYGRSVAVDPGDLKIIYDKNAHCKITVLRNDPFSSRIGSIIPSKFPCDFKATTVFYQHYGSMTTLSDIVKLQIQLDTEQETIAKHFVMNIQVVFNKPLEILNKIENLMVDELGGLSEPINPTVLNFKFDKEHQSCKVRFMPKNNGPPFYGNIVNTSNIGLKELQKPSTDQEGIVQYHHVTCSEFLSGNLRYAHKRMGRSSNRDYVPLVIEVCDKETDEIKKREFFQMPVRIRRAPDNERPIINYNLASYSLQVDQVVLTALTSSIMRAEDRETDGGSIIFNITHKLADNQGYLVHTDNPNRPLTTFYQKELDELKIAYKPPEKLSTTQRLQQIWMEARDSEGASSAPFYIIVVIKPMNSNSPQVNRNTGLTMFEGQSRALTRDVFEVRDPDNEQDVVISVLKGLFHGRLQKNGDYVYEFSILDIDKGLIRYVHDDSNTYTDNVVFKISDGTHDIFSLLLITIVAVDDESPKLTYNTGLTLNEGKVQKIDQFDLSASDIDSDNTEIKFRIMEATKAGYICYRRSSLAENNISNNDNSWTFKDNAYEKEIKEFTQVDVVLGLVYYRHLDDEIFQDQFIFKVFDNADVPNESNLRKFMINILPVDDLKPVVVPSATLELKALEGKTATFSKQVLQFTDEDSNDNELEYGITKQPHFEDESVNAGHLSFTHEPAKAIKTFTQKQVNHFKIIYTPPEKEIGLTTKIVSFEFNVKDPRNNSVENQEFKIHIFPVNNQEPVPFVNLLKVDEGKKIYIEAKHLYADDADNHPDELSFALKKVPLHGDVLLLNKKINVGAVITLDNIKENEVLYLHDGSESTVDEIKFMLTDNLHHSVVHLPIMITPMDDEAPVVKIMTQLLNVDENEVIQLHESMIEMSDEDTDSEKLVFLVTKQPQYGQLEKGGTPTDTFTIQDLKQNLITYHHTKGETGIEVVYDYINLTASDGSNDMVIGGNLYTGITLNVNIQPVNSEAPVVTGEYFLDVVESKSSVLSEKILKVTDVDTKLKDVICNILELPTFGFLQTSSPVEGSEVSRDGIAVNKFNAHDLNDLHVSYNQNNHKRVEPTNDRVVVQCTDGVNTASKVTINIGITPFNDEQPVAYVQSNIMCVEDDIILFDLSKINPFDGDEPEEQLVITVTKQPKNGELLLQKTSELVAATIFTKDALTSEFDTSLMYQHKGTETVTDSFEINVSDGVHNTTKEVNIKIISMDDETPRMTVNTGLNIERLETKIITYRNLKTVDLDSEDARLMYIVMMAPTFGKLQKVVSPSVIVEIGKGGNFTQKDIMERKIRYTHLSKKSEELDVIRLDVTDGFNRLINQIFNILIKPEDNVIPEVVNNGVYLNENGRIILTTDMLSATDLNTPDEKLEFVITKTPLRGHTEHLDNDGIPITRFSQLALAAQKIVYIHTSTDEIKTDNFEFEVNDGNNKVFRTFRINLKGVNNKLPLVRLKPVKVMQTKNVIITPFELNVVDNDTIPVQLKFKIMKRPSHGKILMDGKTQVAFFTSDDIHQNRIMYSHTGITTSSDEISLKLMDGDNEDYYLYPDFFTRRREDITLKIKVKKIDIHAPVIINNKGAYNLKTWKSNKIFRFTPSKLKAVDDDTNNNLIRYSIKKYPKHGKVVRYTNIGRPLSKFTQADINAREIIYLLNNGSKASSDSFVFDLYDSKKNMLRGQTFSLNWPWINVHQSHYEAKENDEYIVLNFNRTGYLRKTSFAVVEIINPDQNKPIDFIQLFSKNTIQFNVGQAKASLNIKLVDNTKYEKKKSFSVKLSTGLNGLIGDENNSTVTIIDPEDEPTVAMEKSDYVTEESVGILNIPLFRTGDVEELIKVICITKSDTALGSVENKIQSNDDYITKLESDRTSIVTFDTNVTSAFCPITIIDDSLYEEQETFTVSLVPFYGGKVGTKYQVATITIQEDKKDEASFSLQSSNYTIDESDGKLQVIVYRKGSDLSFKSYVVLATRQTIPASAKANVDYYSLVKTLEFNVDETKKVVDITIIDDIGRPLIEGNETFEVILSLPTNGKLTDPNQAIVTITDEQSDKPIVYFNNNKNISVDESSGNVTVFIERAGDLRHESYVRCYTRQASAEVTKDFIERLDTNQSFIKFERKEYSKPCTVNIVDDNSFEKEESFRIVLGSHYSKHTNGGVVADKNTNDEDSGPTNEIHVLIQDDDKPSVEIEKNRFYILEPTYDEYEKNISIPVVRTGDLSKVLFVTAYTKDGSAKSGIHYKPLAKLLRFEKNETRKVVDITVYHVSETSLRTAFSLNLLMDENQVINIGRKKTVVYIEEGGLRTGVTFPLNPVVISLMDLDRSKIARQQPSQGYPLICLTACHESYPRYEETKELCKDETIENKLSKYRWQIAAPDASDGVTSRFQDINMRVFFTTPEEITLDSIYFTAGSRIRCVAQAFSADYSIGIASYSDPVTINPLDGLCMPKRASDIGAESFSAQVSYTGMKDKKYKNLVKLKILIPHFDGLLPAVSTKHLSNFELTLSPDASRTGQHKCSNLLDTNEITTKHGFIKALSSYAEDEIIASQPHEFDDRYRSNSSIRFYQNLNLDACLWKFESYFDMTELVQDCGGRIVTDGLVKDAVQSHLAINVPLHVSYIYHSPNDEDGWTDFNHHSSFRLTALYNTGVLWKDGVALPEQAKLQGNLYPASIIIRKSDRRLQMNFRTKSRFRGIFLIKSKDGRLQSTVVSPENPSLKFKLNIIRSDPTFAEPEQLWQIISNFAVRDYSGTYHFKLIPCVAAEDVEYSIPPDCTPMEAVSFKLNFTIQQTSEPVEATFTLNTRFYLLNSQQQWLSKSLSNSQVTDVAFAIGDPIYGRVMIDGTQSIGDAYHIVIEKVFICSGIDGFIPIFDPKTKHYGCVADSPNLIFRFKILDRLNPETEVKEFGNVNFDARLAVDESSGRALVKQSGADGFMLSSTPLFKVSAGRTWFLHVIYTLRSQATKNRGIGRRSIEYNAISSLDNKPHRERRDVPKTLQREMRDIGRTQGTNLQMITLQRPLDESLETPFELETSKKKDFTNENSNADNTLIIVICVLIFIIILAIIIAAVVISKSKQGKPVPSPNGGTEI